MLTKSPLNYLRHLETVLQESPKYMVDGKLVKHLIVEDALKCDQVLLDLLLRDEETKSKFFEKMGGGVFSFSTRWHFKNMLPMSSSSLEATRFSRIRLGYPKIRRF